MKNTFFIFNVENNGGRTKNPVRYAVNNFQEKVFGIKNLQVAVEAINAKNILQYLDKK